MVHKANTQYTPEAAGYDPAILDRLDAHFLRCIDKGLIQAAAYILSRDGKVFANRSMGRMAHAADSKDFLPDSIRPIASITKVFTATAILQLMEQGKCWLEQPVCELIDEFKTEMHHHINIFHLLTHTSGLSGDPGSFFEPYVEEWDEAGWTRENWIKRLLTGPLQFKPGARWSYCSKGFSILAEIVARLSGVDYDEYLQANIFKPLGMNDSFLFVPDGLSSRVSTTKSDWNARRVKEKKSDVISPSMLGGGGIFSTLPDLEKLGQAMLGLGRYKGARLLGRKTAEAAVRPQVKDAVSYSWQPHIYDDSYRWTCGLGWEVNKHRFLSEGVFDHEGAEGAGIFIDPKEKFVFAGFYPDVDYHTEAWINPLAIAWSGIV